MYTPSPFPGGNFGGLSQSTLQDITRSVPQGKYPNYPWAAQLESNPSLFANPYLMRGGAGLLALLAAKNSKKLIPGDHKTLEELLRRGSTGAAMGAPFGAPGMMVGGLANAALNIL